MKTLALTLLGLITLCIPACFSVEYNWYNTNVWIKFKNKKKKINSYNKYKFNIRERKILKLKTNLINWFLK